MTNDNRDDFENLITLVSENDLVKRKKILSKMLSSLVSTHLNLSSYIEGLFQAMLVEHNAILLIKLSRWLNNNSLETQKLFTKLKIEGKLLKLFEKFLENWTQELVIELNLQNSGIHQVYPSELFPNLKNISVPVGVIHQESHHLNHVDIVYVCSIANLIKANNIFEFGTYRGQTTVGLASVCPEATVYTLNIPPEGDKKYSPYLGSYISKFPDRGRIRQIFCDSRKFDTEEYKASMDFIFIDGDHSYEIVKNDTEKSFQMLKAGGAIVWHDYATKSPGVCKYLNELSQTRRLFRLKKTCVVVYLDESCHKNISLATLEPSLEVDLYDNM